RARRRHRARRLHQRRAAALPERHLRRTDVDRRGVHDPARAAGRPGVHGDPPVDDLERTPLVTTIDTTTNTDRSTEPVSQPATMIHLDGVSKTYPGTSVPAVADLDLEIPRGEILV